MHSEGWLIVADDLGLVRITCPDHDAARGTQPEELPDYLVPDDYR